jgi:DNA-binding NtrC family response regulator
VSSVIESSRQSESSPERQGGERVLIVEDDRAARIGLTELIRAWGYVAEDAADGEEALQKITTFRPGIVLTDLVMPRLDGLGLLRALQDQLTDLCVVILTAQGTVETAVEAIRDGAYDYLTKPVDPHRLQILLAKAVERQETRREVRELRRQLRDQGSFGRIIGNTPAIRKLYRTIEQAAPTGASVLIWGESGTGKELVAQTIHQLSDRASQPYIAINCAAIPETLLESEIFGHEKGAFTGAVERRLGCFELAHRGTLFLDEIAEMVPVTQVKLLRVLQERTFRRLGGRTEQNVDVRIIAATNVNPLDAVAKGKLREDLYYRLNVFSIELPPLRARKEDIPLLVQAFISEFASRNGREVKGVSHDALALLSLAGQHPRAAQRHRARHDPHARRVHRAGAAAARAVAAACRGGRDAPDHADGRHDRRRGGDAPHRDHARPHGAEQDACGGAARHQPQDAAQQAESHEGAGSVAGLRPARHPCA